MMPDETNEKPPEFQAFRDLTRKLLEVSKEDLDKARQDARAAPNNGLPKAEEEA